MKKFLLFPLFIFSISSIFSQSIKKEEAATKPVLAFDADHKAGGGKIDKSQKYPVGFESGNEFLALYKVDGPYSTYDKNSEVLDLRDAYSKHFRNANGTTTAVITAGPQHYLRDGLWHTIVNDITANTGADAATYPYTNTYNSHSTLFGSSVSSLFVVKASENDVLLNISQPKIVFFNAEGAELGDIAFNSLTAAKVTGNKILYTDVAPGIDVTAEQNASGFKYSYIIKNLQALQNLPQGTASIGIAENVETGFQVIENGSTGRVVFKNGEQEIRIKTFLIYDSHANQNRERASKISYENSRLTYHLQADWFTDPNRVFPIYIDPTVTYTPTATSWWTGTVDDDSGCDVSTDNDNDNGIRIGFDDGSVDDDYYSGYAKFNINALPTNACIQNAYSRFFQNNFRNTQSGSQCWGNDDQLQYYYGGISPITFDPVPASCDAINTAITAAPAYQTLNVFSGYPFSTANGWKDYNAYNLNAVVTSARASQNYMTLSFDQFGSHSDPSFQFCCFCTPDNDDWIDYDGWSSGNRPQLVVTYETPFIIGTTANVSVNNVCAGTNVTLTLTGGTNGSVGNWAWYSGSCGGTAVGTSTASNASLTISAPTSTTTYYVRGENICGNTACQSVTLTVLQPSVAATSINASTNPICQGGSGTTLSVVGGSLGAGANWQWYTGGCGTTAAGTGTSINVNPGSTTIYYVRAEGTCNSTVCRQITVTVNTPTVGGSASTSTPSVCINNTATLNLGGQNGAVLFWEMQLNGGGYSSIGNAGLTSITSGALITAGTYDFRARVQNSPCAALYSSSVSVTVVPASVGGTASPSLSPVCINGNTTVSLSGNTGTVINWEQQINGGGWTNIGNAGLTSISTGVLNTAGTWQFRAIVQNSPCGTATSAIANITVNSPSVGGFAASSGTLICNGSNPTISLSGQTGSVLYWEQQINGGGFNNIGNSGLATFPAGALPPGTYAYRAVVQNSPCATATSSSVTITVSDFSIGGSAVPNTTQICQGSNTNITLTGNTGSILYWEQQINGGGWSSIGNAGLSIINSGILTPGNNEFRAVIQNGGCPSVTSSTAFISVDQTSVGGSTLSNFSSVCDGSSVSVILSGNTGNIIQWERQYNGGGWISLGNAGVNPLVTNPLSPYGTYEFRALVQNGVCTSTYSVSTSVTVNQNDDASFNYSSSVFCQGGANASPTIVTGGGTFTASPAGLSINASTGIINLSASTPGTYTVTHITAGICFASATQTITVSPLPNSGFTYASLNYCLNAGTNPVPMIISPGGTFASLNPGLIFANVSTGEINLALSQPGSYFVQYTLGGSCPSTSTQTVILQAPQNANFQYSAPSYCQYDADPSPSVAQIGGVFTSSPTGLVIINQFTGVIDLSASAGGTYTVTYTVPGPCVGVYSQQVTINASAVATLSYGANSFCSNATDPAAVVSPAGGMFTSSPAGLSINGVGTIDVSASAAGAYTVTYTSPGLCGTTATQSINITTAPQAFIQPISALCTGSPATFLSASPSGGTFSGGSYINASGLFNPAASGAGTFPVNYTVSGSGGCSASTIFDVVVNASPTVSITAIPQLCSNDTSYVLTATPNGGTWNGNPFVSVSGLFYPIFAGQGLHPVIYTYNNGNCSATATANIIVLNSPTPSINPTGIVCSSGGPLALSSNISGGTWSGGTYISSSGVFNPALANLGSNSVTYTVVSGPCTAQSTAQIAVSGGPNVQLLPPNPFCVNDSPDFILANIPGGVFAGGGYVSGTGLFNPANASVGNNTVIYTLVGNNGCVGSDTVQVSVNANPNATITYPGIVCEGTPAFSLTAATAGGSWSGGPYINSGVFDAGVAGNGTHDVTYTVTTGGCSSSQTISVTVNPKPISLFNHQPNGLTVYFSDLSQNVNSWSWNFGDGSPEVNDQNPTHLFPDNGIYQVRLIAFNDCGSDTLIRGVLVNKAMGIDENENDYNITLYPNPADQFIQISADGLPENELKMDVLDISGKEIMTEKIYPVSGILNKRVDVYTLTPGVYLIRLSSIGRQHIIKFIKM